jgi:hypothetical protein
MQKIISQDLSGSEEQAQAIVEYSWQEGEIAWLHAFPDVYRVQFTGKRWLVGNQWSRRKIYQFKYLEGSDGRDVETMGLDRNGISHDQEDFFYTTKQEAIERCIRYLINIRNMALNSYEKDWYRLKKFEEKE